MSLRRLSVNAFASSTGTLANALLMIVLYRFLTHELGIESIGVWALLLASTSVARLGEFGMAGGVSRFVAEDLGADRPRQALSTVSMSLAFLAVAVGLGVCLVWPLSVWILERTVDHEGLLSVALQLLPWVLVSTWLAAIVNLFCAALDGHQRTAFRVASMVAGGICQLVVAYLLVPQKGLAALGMVQLSLYVVQATLLFGSLQYVMRQPLTGWFVWTPERARAMLRYGASLQVTAVGQLLFEPSVRWLLGIFSDLTITGYYELASRAVTQLRLALTAGFQMVVPYYAGRIGSSGVTTGQTGRAYGRLLRLVLLVCVPYFLLAGSVLPYFLTWWTGTFSSAFVWIALICLAGWFVNMLSVPAFMLYLATGRLHWVAVTQLSIGVLNVLFGLLLGWRWGGPGVVTGAMLALMVGSVVVMSRFQQEHDVRLYQSLPRILPWTSCVGITALAYLVWRSFVWGGEGSPHWSTIPVFTATVLVLGLLVWLDPLRREIAGQLFTRSA